MVGTISLTLDLSLEVIPQLHLLAMTIQRKKQKTEEQCRWRKASQRDTRENKIIANRGNLYIHLGATSDGEVGSRKAAPGRDICLGDFGHEGLQHGGAVPLEVGHGGDQARPEA